MRLTPLDIRKQEFRKVMRGYDPLEVEAFLDMVADEYDGLLEKRTDYTERIKQLEGRIKEFDKMEQTLQHSLQEAHDSVTHTKTLSRQESEHLLQEANLQAREILADATTEAARLERDILILKSQKESFALRLRHILEGQIELIQVLELDDIGIEGLAAPRRKLSVRRAGYPASGDQAADAPRTARPKTSVAPEEAKRAPRPETTEPAQRSPQPDPELRNDVFAVLGSDQPGEQDLIEKMVLEIEDDEEQKEPEEPTDARTRDRASEDE